MSIETLLLFILIDLLFLTIIVLEAARRLLRFNPERLIYKAVREATRTATSKSTLARIERNSMPFLVKFAAVKIGTYLVIRYVSKKLR